MLSLPLPLILGLVGGLMMVVVLYLDDRANESETDYMDYLKLFISSVMVNTVMVYLGRMGMGMGMGELKKYFSYGGDYSMKGVNRLVNNQDDMYASLPEF